MGAFSRDKGARGELDVCAKLEKHLGVKFHRNLKQYQQAQLGDIEPPAGPYLLEIKNQARLCVPQWWRQACAAASARGLLPCLVYKDRTKWVFMTPMPEARDAVWMNDPDFADRLTLRGFCLRVRERL